MKPRRAPHPSFLKSDPWYWAFRAREELISKLPFLGPWAALGEKPAAILVGYAQEGKTTFALRLLGATPEEVERLEKALRLGRPYGRSATQAPLIYKPVGGPIDEAGLRRVREQIARAYQNPQKVHVIELPIDQRGEVGEVIDLVGLNPRDPEESKRAMNLANSLLAIAPLRFYVTGLDHLANLDPRELNLRRVVSLSIIRKETSFVVLTRAFEVLPDEEKKRLMGHGADPREIHRRSTQYFHEKVWLQLKQSRPSLSKEEVPTVLPVSFGKGVEPIGREVSEISLAKVREQLQRSPLELAVKSFFDVPISLRKMLEDLEKKRSSLVAEMESVEEKIREMEQKKKKIEEEIETLEGEIKRLREEQQNLKQMGTTLPSEVAVLVKERVEKELKGVMTGKYEEPKLMAKIEQLRAQARQFATDVENAIEDVVDKALQNIPLLEYVDRTKIKSSCVGKVRGLLNSRIYTDIRKGGEVIVEGWFGGVKWEESLERLKNWGEKIKREVTRLIVNCVKEKLRTTLKPVLERKLEEIDDEIKLYMLKQRGGKERAAVASSEIEQWRRKLNKLEPQLKELLKEVRIIEGALRYFTEGDFERLLAKHFVSHWNEAVKELEGADDPIVALNCVGHLYAIFKALLDVVELVERGGAHGRA